MVKKEERPEVTMLDMTELEMVNGGQGCGYTQAEDEDLERKEDDTEKIIHVRGPIPTRWPAY